MEQITGNPGDAYSNFGQKRYIDQTPLQTPFIQLDQQMFPKNCKTIKVTRLQSEYNSLKRMCLIEN